MLLNDELEHIATTHDPSLVLPQDGTNIRLVAMFELAIMRAVLRTLLCGERVSNPGDASSPVKRQEEIDTAALEKSLIRLLSEDDEKQATSDIARLFYGVSERAIEVLVSFDDNEFLLDSEYTASDEAADGARPTSTTQSPGWNSIHPARSTLLCAS